MYFTPVYKDIVAQAHLDNIERLEEARQRLFAKRWAAYTGNLPRPLRVLEGDYDDNIILSYPRLTIDIGVAYLFGEGLKFQSDGNAEDETPADKWLNEFWEHNGGIEFLGDIGVNGAVYGHAFVKINEPDAKDNNLPRLTNLCPEQMSVVTNPRNVDEALQFRQQWHGYDPMTGKPIVYRQTTYKTNGGTWEILDEQSRMAGRWEELSRVRWAYDWCPIHHCKNLPAPNDFWGCSDIEEDVLTIHEGVNFNASNLNRIIRYHAHPLIYATGIEDVDLERSVGSTLCLPMPDSKLAMLEMLSQLDGAQTYLEMLQQHYHQATRTPEVVLGRLKDLGQISGIALKLLFAPFVSKIEGKQRRYGAMLKEISLHAQEMASQPLSTAFSVTFPEVLPTDMLTEAQAYQAHAALGVSQRTILEKLGYDAENELSVKAQEQDAQAKRQIEVAQATRPNIPQ